MATWPPVVVDVAVAVLALLVIPLAKVLADFDKRIAVLEAQSAAIGKSLDEIKEQLRELIGYFVDDGR